ncbi:hypothetical protein CAPTEDRAFT_40175, partial [Capitella teleta]
ITEEMLRHKLNKLKIEKSPGPDGQHPRILKELKEVIAGPLADIMQQSLLEGSLSQEWKEANITAIHKKGSKNEPNNYRPVSLTSHVCKIMEVIVRDHML